MPCSHWSRDLNLQTPNQFSISQLISPQRHRCLFPTPDPRGASSLDALSRASPPPPLPHHFLPPQTRNHSIPGRHPPPLTLGPTVAASARPLPAGGTPASRGCRPGASRLPRRGPGSREGGGPATPRRDSPGRGGAPASRQPRRGGGGAVRRPHLSAARPRTPAKRRPGAEGPRPSLRRSPCRSPRRGSLGLALPLSDGYAAVALSSLAFHRPRPAAEERTDSGAPIGWNRYGVTSPDRASGSEWLARRLFSTSAPDWLLLTLFPGEPLTLHSSSASHP